MSDVFQNNDPPPPHCPASVYPPARFWCGGRIHSLGGVGGEGAIFWKSADTALYSTYVSTLWIILRTRIKLHRLSFSLLKSDSPPGMQINH